MKRRAVQARPVSAASFRRCTACLGNQSGVAYLALMFSIVLIGITLMAAAKPWKMVMQREREADLLAYGMEIQRAIGAYSVKMKAGRVQPGEVYPTSLEELTRQPSPLLRKVYLDPITKTALEIVRAPTGGIMGVRSRSKAMPVKQHEFPDAVRHFDNMKSYRDWVFQHPNASGSTLPQNNLTTGLMGQSAMPGGVYPGGVYPGGVAGQVPSSAGTYAGGVQTGAMPGAASQASRNLPGGFQTDPPAPVDPAQQPQSRVGEP
ncbi:MAG: hypothetical protein U0172_01290 [Nitrospiraceae bacterium]